MEGGALQKDEFTAWAKDFVLFLHVTSRVESDPYQTLLQEKGGRGFPYLVFMDAEGKVIAEHNGARDVEGFKKRGEQVRSFVALKKKVEGGDASARVDYLVASLGMGPMSAEELEKRLKECGELSKEQKAKLDPLLLNNEVRCMLETAQDEEGAMELAPKFVEMKKAGRIPTGDDEMVGFWLVLLNYGEQQKDVPLFEESLKALREKLKDNPRATKFLDSKEEALKAMKEPGGKKDEDGKK